MTTTSAATKPERDQHPVGVQREGAELVPEDAEGPEARQRIGNIASGLPFRVAAAATGVAPPAVDSGSRECTMSSTAPEVMALSAMLKVYQWWLRQYQSMKSTTLPKRNRSTRLPIAPPATSESATVSRRLSRPQRRRKTTISAEGDRGRADEEGAPAERGRPGAQAEHAARVAAERQVEKARDHGERRHPLQVLEHPDLRRLVEGEHDGGDGQGHAPGNPGTTCRQSHVGSTGPRRGSGRAAGRDARALRRESPTFR